MCQKSLNFTYAFNCYQQKCKWLHFSWATLYVQHAVREAATISPRPCKLTFDLESGVSHVRRGLPLCQF